MFAQKSRSIWYTQRSSVMTDSCEGIHQVLPILVSCCYIEFHSFMCNQLFKTHWLNYGLNLYVNKHSSSTLHCCRYCIQWTQHQIYQLFGLKLSKYSADVVISSKDITPISLLKSVLWIVSCVSSKWYYSNDVEKKEMHWMGHSHNVFAGFFSNVQEYDKKADLIVD